MAKIANTKGKDEVGCGFMGGIFQLRACRLRKSSVHSLPMRATNNEQSKKDSKKPPSSHESNLDQKPNRKSTSDHPSTSISHPKNQNQRHSDASTARSSVPISSTNSSQSKVPHNQDLNSQSKHQREPICETLELARISTHDLQCMETKSHTPKLEGNLIKMGNLLRNNNPTIKTVDYQYLSRNVQERNSHNSYGNIVRKNSDELVQRNRVDPEVLKSMGNEAYKQGRFEEALGLYNRAIALDSSKATYHSNKSAALIGLGRLMEAISECKEAIKLDPSYHRAHSRLATLYLRLGEAEKSREHCNKAGPYGDIKLMDQAEALQNRLKKCNEGRKVNDWVTVLKETEFAISLGADSAPQVYALQSEALLKLLRHREAYETYQKIHKCALDSCPELFGLVSGAYLLMIGAQISLSAGRFEDAVAEAEKAARFDPSNKEVNAVLKRARAVSSARVSGNLLFKASKFTEACVVYNQGLEHDPTNPILLCNRAASRSKLGQFEKAVEDCTAALALQPSYRKARLRRADCNAKLERWEASIQDYEMLIRERPGDEEVARALFDAQLQLKKQRGEDIKDFKFGSSVVFISGNDRFRHYVTSPGMSVVLFCNRTTKKQVLLVLEQTCKRFPSVNFLKVEIEQNPYLVKCEGVNSVPTFRIYKNGSRVKEIPGNDSELLERSVKIYSS